MQNLKFKWTGVIGILVILLMGYFFLRWWNRGVITIKTAKVVRGSIELAVSASGIVDAPVYELGSRLGGKIVFWKVKEGDKVVKDELLVEFEEAQIVAPAEGIVAKINYEEGETVPPGFPALILVNYQKYWVEAQIDEIDIAEVKIGDPVKITSDVYPHKIYEGEVSWIAPLAELRKVGGRIKLDEESYVFPGKIKFLGSHSELKVNMSVNVDITTKSKTNALIIPREALVSKNDTSAVFVVRKGRVYQTPIEIGIRSFTSVEALAGVSEEAILAITEVSKLKDKGRVKIEH